MPRVSQTEPWIKPFRRQIAATCGESWYVRNNRGRIRLEVRDAGTISLEYDWTERGSALALPRIQQIFKRWANGQITLAQALNMKSGIRIDRKKVTELRKEKDLLLGQGQIQAYLQYSAPIPVEKKSFKYQGSDPSIAMQVLEAVVPGSARDFIETELLKKLGITNFAWQDDVSGLPKSAAGSSMRSRDMLKWGMLVSSGGKWNDEQLIPADFVQKATDRINTNPQGTSYGYFWWRHDMRVGDRIYDCRSGRGAGGQFILMLPELDLIIVMTAHQQGMGKMLSTVPKKLLPAFARNK